MTSSILIVSVENVLVHVKSGDRYPRNIADFIPDYNLWYAIKFFGPSEIWVVENYDVTSHPDNIGSHETKLAFISKWLSQMTNIPCRHLYSLRGNFIPGWGYEGDDDLVDLILRFIEVKNPNLLYTGNDINYYKSRNINTITPEEFISKYNKNPRIYEKK